MTFWQSSTWGAVLPGDTVLGADREAWDVTGRHGNGITMVREGRRPTRGTPNADRPVKRKPGETSRAVAVLADAFPGVEILACWDSGR